MADFHESLNAARKKVSGVVSLRELGWRGESGRFLSTGIRQLDDLLGGKGLPVGRISEFCGPGSAGKTGLVSRVMAGVTRGGGCVAYLDFFNALSPEFLQAAGVDLENILWIRGPKIPVSGDESAGGSLLSSGDADDSEGSSGFLRRALKQAELLVKSGNFTLVVLDLAETAAAGTSLSSGSRGRLELPGGFWFRLQRAAEKSRSVLILLSGERMTSGAAARVLSLQGKRGIWGGEKVLVSAEPAFFRPPGNREKHALLQGMRSSLSVTKGGRNGRSIVFHCHL